MAELDLEPIEARSEGERFSPPDGPVNDLDMILDHDMPALIAEVRQLRERIELLEGGAARQQALKEMWEGRAEGVRELQTRRAGFEAVSSTSADNWIRAEEYRCISCGAIGARAGIDHITLADLDGLADRHECLPRFDELKNGGGQS